VEPAYVYCSASFIFFVVGAWSVEQENRA